MTNPRPNPYPGPRPFRRGETLYGRQRETAELLDLLIAERIALLASPSGAGKTSLVQAALVPALEAEGFRVLPVMRPGLLPEDAPPGGLQHNRYVLSLLLGLERAWPDEEQTPLSKLAGMTLAEYLQARWPIPAGDDWHGDVLLFDQFEEALTVDPTDRAAKHAFFEQVGQALRDRNRWGLFSMREEYVASLDPYLQPIPARFDRGRRYRLDLLGQTAAKAAMQGPAADQTPRVIFTDDAVSRLVDDLRRTQVQAPDGTMATAEGQHIEPVQLQVVCRRLWEGLAPDDLTIDLDDVAAVGDVDAALRGFYADTVKAVAASSGVRERAIREWCNGQLITEGGIRGQVLLAVQASQGLANAAIWPLVDSHLVRADQRRGATWFELAHDRLIAPVRADNAAWFEAHLSPLQHQAALWERQKRPDRLLLRAGELDEAETWAANHDAEVEDIERDFLAACRAERAAVEEQRRQAKRLRRWQTGIVATIFGAVILAALAGFYLYFNQVEATRLASSRELAAQSASQLNHQYDLALLLSMEANQIADSVEARGSLLSALEHTPQLVQFVRDRSDRVSAVAFSPDGRLLATAGGAATEAATASAWGGIVSLWDVSAGGAQLKTSLGALPSPAVAAAFSPAGDALAVGSEDGTLHLWDLRSDPPVAQTWAAHSDRVNSLAFSPDGRWLASAGKKDVLLWDLTVPGQPARNPLLSGEAVLSLAFDPAGHTLAVGYDDGRVRLWDVAAQQASELAGPGKDRQANSLAFSPDGQRLASARADQTVVVWDLATSQAMTLTGHTGNVQAVAFNSDGTLLASAGRDESVRMWNVASGQAQYGQQSGSTLDAHDGWVMGVAFHPDGQRLASAGYDGNVVLWDTAARSRLGRSLAGLHDDEVWAVALSPDGRRAASVGKDHRVVLWDLATGQPTELGRHADSARAVAFSPDGATVASGGHDGAVRRWDISGAQPVELDPLIHAPAQWVSGVAFSPDGQFLASSGFDKTIKLWNLRATPPVSRTLTGHSGEVWSVAFSNDSKRLASGDDEGQIILWDVAQGQAQGEPLSGSATVMSVAFSPDGRRLASGDSDRRVVVWDIANRNPSARLVGQEASISGVAFSPDGATLASSSHDGSTVLWDVLAQRLIGQPLRGHTLPVNGLAYSQDGRLVADVSDDHTMMLWDVAFESWQARACRIAGRNLTLEEWQQYLGAQPYHLTCPDLPGQDAITQESPAVRAATTEEKP